MQLQLTDNFIVATPTEIDLQDVNLESIRTKVLFDCCTTLVDENVTLPYGPDHISFPHTINADGDVFKDGVYQVEIYAEYANGSKVSETLCIFVDTTLKCEVAEFVSKNVNTDLGWLYVVLTKTNECDCNCTYACEILKKIRIILGQQPASCPTC
jgi:hypothetical protein